MRDWKQRFNSFNIIIKGLHALKNLSLPLLLLHLRWLALKRGREDERTSSFVKKTLIYSFTKENYFQKMLIKPFLILSSIWKKCKKSPVSSKKLENMVASIQGSEDGVISRAHPLQIFSRSFIIMKSRVCLKPKQYSE